MTHAADTQPAGRAPTRPAAAIIPFPAGRRAPATEPPAGPARILLFTGVRYERLPEPAEVAEAARPRAGGRPARPRRAAPARRRQPS
jgi:hypothetical protein